MIDIPLRTARNPSIPRRARLPRRPPTREVIINLLERQARRLGHEQERQHRHPERDAKVEIADVGPHVPVLDVQHVRRPEAGAEGKGGVDHRRARLAVGSQAHGVHFRRAEPDAAADEAAEDEGPDAEEGDEDGLGRGGGAAEAGRDGGEDEHARGHAGVAGQHSEAAAAVLDDEGSEEGAGQDADGHDDVDEVGVVDADTGKEDGGVGNHELYSGDGEADEDHPGDERTTDIVAVEDFGPARRRPRGFLKLDVILHFVDLGCDLRGIGVLLVEFAERTTRLFLLAVDEEPPGRLGKYHDAYAVDNPDGDLAENRHFPGPVVEDIRRACADRCGGDVPECETDVV